MKNKMEFGRPELLAPAGDSEKLRAAVLYGADAVYLAGKNFGLRAQSGNFSMEELAESIAFAHDHGVRCYITMNIFAHEGDFAGLEETVLAYEASGADALIVSDAGLFRRIRQLCPQMEIHISTQASVTNAESCLFWYELGAKRIVLARELTLEEIVAIRRKIPAELELEAFVHGAMCMAYSGRCLLSDFYTGRSANKGACAQPCRWGYKAEKPEPLVQEVYEEKRPEHPLLVEEDERGSYIFNSRDLCLIDYIPELVKAGINSFKIEGRMKGAFYAAATVKAYRAALDSYLADPKAYSPDPRWRQDLERTVHRVFDTGFYFDRPQEDGKIFSTDTYIQPAFVAAQVEGYDQERALLVLRQKNKILEGDQLLVMQPLGYREPLQVSGLLDENFQPVESTKKAGALYYLPVKEPIPAHSFLIRDGKKEGE